MGDFADAAKKVKRLSKNLDDSHEAATDRGMDKVQSELQRALRLQGSVARGVLVQDIEQTTLATSEVAKAAVTLPEWAKYLERGTGTGSPYPAPQNPPYGPILEWAQAKPITPIEYATIEDAAAAIAQSIADDGTDPHPFITPVWHGRYGKQYIIDENRRAMSTALRRSF
jgi:hypothetical protein